MQSCDDSLAGVWREERGPEGGDTRRYHFEENRFGIEIFAMFDTTRPPEGDKASSPVIYAPVAFDLRRRKRPGATGLSGTRSQRVTRDGRACLLRTPATIDACRHDALVLRFQQPGAVDWATCKPTQAGEWQSLTLRRE